MKYILLLIAANLTSLTFAAGSVIMAINGIDGWGWMVVAAIVTLSGIRYKSNEAKP